MRKSVRKLFENGKIVRDAAVAAASGVPNEFYAGHWHTHVTHPSPSGERIKCVRHSFFITVFVIRYN